jgi:DNA-binding SARP family transcriptional activator
VLQPAGADERLRYRAPGYVLTVLEDELDAAQFSSRVSEARDHASAADHRRAADLLESALALWRGDALAEFDPARLDADADLARLAELRLVATEEHAQALLQLGRGREVVTELEALVRRFPERERLTVLLMRALYGSGRQADALSAYQRLRRHLVQELGVEPSEPTRAIHRQLLEHDPTLTRRTPARRRTCPAAAPASWAGRTRSAGWPMCCRPARW